MDYDTFPEYRLNITAHDLGYESRTAAASLTILLTDVNDNAPKFDKDFYVTYLPENSPAGSEVYKIVATDKDSARNAIIHYSIVGGDGRQYFNIEKSSGLIKSTNIFDYEQRQKYELKIVASNPDSAMSSSTQIIINITGVNEFYPKFDRPVYHFEVSESSEINTKVGQVFAEDKDMGEDGIIFYLLVGGSNDRGFTISPTDGVIKVSRRLDRETQSRIVLTVIAKNAGPIYGDRIDEAQVVISVQDGNDPPEFEKNIYETTITENAPQETNVISVKAFDKDVRLQNNQFIYSILSGNTGHAFKINTVTGLIQTAGKLDRETKSEYALIVAAIDTGNPPQTGTATLLVTLSDVNDNGPILSPNQLMGHVMENEPIGTLIMALSATDPDAKSNGAPFKYYLTGGSHMNYVTINENNGEIKTAVSLDRELTPELDIMIEIEDSGAPVQRSTFSVRIVVDDQNDNPSYGRKLSVLLYSFNNALSNSSLADVRPADDDLIGDYQCHQERQDPFIITRDCKLGVVNHISPSKIYKLLIKGNDGRHGDVVSTVTVQLINIDDDTLQSSTSIHIANITVKAFLDKYYGKIYDLLMQNLSKNENLLIYSVQEYDLGVDIIIAIRDNLGKMKSSDHTAEYLTRWKKDLQLVTGGSNLQIGSYKCKKDACSYEGTCNESINLHPGFSVQDSKNLSIGGPIVRHEYSCKCPIGFPGKNCVRNNDPCSSNPCMNNGMCVRKGNSYYCECSSRYIGDHCETNQISGCYSDPCMHGGSCREAPDGISTFCLCRPGYRGEFCEIEADACRPNPCLHSGVCNAIASDFQCVCLSGWHGRRCERSAFGFPELSYAAFPSLDGSSINEISLIFSTKKQDGLLMYDYGIASNGRSDFLALQLVSGVVVFSFGGARSAITTVKAGKNLGNGKWWKIVVSRQGRVATLGVSACSSNGDDCEECNPGDSKCYAAETGPAG